MALIEPVPTHSYKVLLLVGIPSFIIAVILSLVVHQYAHALVRKHACPGESATQVTFIGQSQDHAGAPDCPMAALAGIAATIILALASFGIFIHFPRNLLFASMAFINATSRLPEAITLFSQHVVNEKSKLISDESAALGLLHFKDPTAYVVILLFYILCLFFFTVIVIHDAQVVRRKWFIAIALFLALGPLQQFLSKFLVSIIT